MKPPPLLDAEKAAYEWQMWVHDFGEEGQRKLKAASVLISRCGGVGGAVATQLAAAGIGRLLLAHAGNVKPSDLNRQTLMTHDWLGKPRVECAARRLRELNPRLEVVAVAENISCSNVAQLAAEADVVVDCAPLFTERSLMNAEAVRQKKPLIECAVYELEAHLTTIIPGQTACLACIYPETPPDWNRRFPVFGAVAGMIGSMGAMEAIKLLAAFGQPLRGRLLTCDLRQMSFQTFTTRRDPKCLVCAQAGQQ